MFLLLFVFLLFKIPIFIRLFFLPYRDDHYFYLLSVFDAFDILAGYILSNNVSIFMMLSKSAFHSFIFLSSSYCCYVFLIIFPIFSFKIPGRNCCQLITAHTGVVSSLSYSLNSQIVVSGGNDHFIKLFKIAISPSVGK